MEDKPRPELADLDDRCSHGTPTTGLRAFADPADIATVFDRLGYRPPAARTTSPTPGLPTSKNVDGQEREPGPLDAQVNVVTGVRGTGKSSYWATLMLGLLKPAEQTRIFAAGSYAHGAVVRAVNEMLLDVVEDQHRRDACTVAYTTNYDAWLEDALDLELAAGTRWADTIRNYWAHAFQRPPRTMITEGPTDARFLLYLTYSRGSDPSPASFLLDSLRPPYSECDPLERNADLVLRSADGRVFVVQAKTTAKPSKHRARAASQRRESTWMVCSGGPSDDGAAAFQLGGATEKDWLQEPIRVTRLDPLPA